jgi:hypothetical protein
MTTDDGELVASFEPGGQRHVLVVAFDELQDMVRARERIVSEMCGWTDEGERYDRAEVLAMVAAAYGERPLLDGSIVGRLLVSSRENDESMEGLRRHLVKQEMQRRAPLAFEVPDAWKPGPEHYDMLEKWADEAVAVAPAGEGWRPRAKTARVREGYNAFVHDHGRDDLALHGVHGGRAFVDFVRRRFEGEAEYARNGSNPYVVGLYRKPGARGKWFPTIMGAPE